MEARCGVKAKELAANYKLAASISREVLTLLEEQPKRVEVLNNLYHYCSEIDDVEGAFQACKERVEVYRPIAAASDAERNGQPDLNLIFYLYAFAYLLRRNNKLEEST